MNRFGRAARGVDATLRLAIVGGSVTLSVLALFILARSCVQEGRVRYVEVRGERFTERYQNSRLEIDDVGNAIVEMPTGGIVVYPSGNYTRAYEGLAPVAKEGQ